MSQRTLQIINVALTTANDEYSIAIPAGAINVQMKLADATHTVMVYQVSVGNGGSPANFWTIDAAQLSPFGPTKQDPQTLYLMSGTASVSMQVSYYLDQ
jgi:hypothetical protein